MNQSERTKLSRVNEKNIPENTEILDLDTTIKNLRELLPWTQGRNRTLYRNKALYASLLFHSKDIKLYANKISEKIYCLIHNRDAICKECNTTIKFISYTEGYSNCNNKECSRLSCRCIKPVTYKVSVCSPRIELRFSGKVAKKDRKPGGKEQ